MKYTRTAGLLMPAMFFMLGAMALSGCKPAGQQSDTPSKNSAEVRYKVTVTVDTPEGERSGSSVWSWKLSRPTVALVSAYNGKFKGEAVAVDLPSGKTLFGLVKGQEGLVLRQFRDLRIRQQGKREDKVADIRNIAAKIGEARPVPCEKRAEDDARRPSNFAFDCVQLVSFADITDPTSVFAVDYHDAAESLGNGYAIKAITVTITDEPVTKGIEKRLGWLADKNRKKFDPDQKPVGIPLGDYRGLFSRGVRK